MMRKKYKILMAQIAMTTSVLALFSPLAARTDAPPLIDLYYKMPLKLFPLNPDHYPQQVSHWLNPNDPDYRKPLVDPSYQKQRFNEFYNHVYALNGANASSPWSPQYVEQTINQQPDVATLEKQMVDQLSNQKETGYGENFRPHTQQWLNAIANNMQISQFQPLFHYDNNQRGITVENLQARILPTDDVHFYSYNEYVQVYPFDNLQVSAVWIGTPVYVLGQTQDRIWDLVLTPDFIGWVHSQGVAKIDAGSNFMNRWQNDIQEYQLAAITRTKTSMIDEAGAALEQTYVGTVFPIHAGNAESSELTVDVPTRDASGHAQIHYAALNRTQAAIMPLPATPKNFARVLQTMRNRPYGWGGMYYYNDCSAELKSLYTPFGIWLPRHSSYQVNAGRLDDQSQLSAEKRIQYLQDKGHKLMTIVYIGGHIFMYIGNYANPDHSSQMAMTYQNAWGLKPQNPPDSRSVLGESVFFPLLMQYTEDPNLGSQADKKYFQISYLDEEPAPQLGATLYHPTLRDLIAPED